MSQAKRCKFDLNSKEYAEALGFAVYTYLTGAIAKRDLYKGGATRYLGEYVEHVIRGKLAEIAFKKFLLKNFGFQTIVDIDLPYYIRGKYLPDILAFKESGVWHVSKFWIDVKAVTEEQKWMLVRASSLRGGQRAKPRPYDAYVNVKVFLPREHLGGLIKHAPLLKNKISQEWMHRMPDLKKVEVEIVGFALYGDINRILQWYNSKQGSKRKQNLENQLNSIFGQGKWNFFRKDAWLPDPNTGEKTVQLGSDNCAIVLSELRSEGHWPKLLKMIRKNRPLVPKGIANGRTKLSKLAQSLKKSGVTRFQTWWRRSLDS